MMPPIDRRTVIRSLGYFIALPFLEAMLPTLRTRASQQTSKKFVQFFSPFGMILHDNVKVYKDNRNWRSFYIPEYTLDPLKTPSLKDQYVIYRGVYNAAAEDAQSLSKRDFPHTLEATGFFCGTTNDSIKNSIDQIYLKTIETVTPLGGLQLLAPGHDNDRFFYNGSFKDGRTMARYSDPKLLFRHLHGHGARIEEGKSILDGMLVQLKQLRKQVSGSDRRIIDEHVAGIRETEKALLSQQSKGFCGIGRESSLETSNSPPEYDPTIRLLIQMGIGALNCDLIDSLVIHLGGGHDPKLRYDFLKVPGFSPIAVDLHNLSHYRNPNGEKEFFAQFREVNKYHVSLLAETMGQLKQKTTGNGNDLLEQTIGLYGCGISQSHFHNYKNIPLIRFGHNCLKRENNVKNNTVTFDMKTTSGKSYNQFVQETLGAETGMAFPGIG